MRSVKVRKLEIGDGSVKICVPVIAHTYKELTHSLEILKKSEFDIAEFRADFYFEEDGPALEALRKCVGDKPILYTIRTQEEGGEIEISDDSYEERNLAAAGFADMVDVQLNRLHSESTNTQLHSSLVYRLHRAGVKVVGSWHDFDGTPECDELVEKMVRMQLEDCDITKIAVMPRFRRDVMELIAASHEMLKGKADRPFITMSMGNMGKVTRAACAFTGSCISFGTAGAMSAPGQIPSDTLREILRILAI